ncbi:MAG: helix-turn-helix domain-containing protein [Pseudomonadota bacterium]
MSKSPPSSNAHLEFIAPSDDMAGVLHTLVITRTGAGRSESIMPAYSAQLFSFVEGTGAIQFSDSDVFESADISLNAPMMRAAPMMFDGPVLNVGASFTPLGWAAFSGLAADKFHDRAFTAEEIVPADALAQARAALAKARDGTMPIEHFARALEDMIRQVCANPKRKPKADHVELVAAIEAWLDSAFNPPVEALYDAVDLGQRQVQRLCRRYFGVPPAQLIKRYRAIRAAILLAHEDLSDEKRDEVLSAYFDQAHLIHDIRRYTGRTPKGLAKETLAVDMLDPDGHGEAGRKLRGD